MKFEFNERALNAVADEAVVNWAQRFQPVLDRVHAAVAGHPVDEVKQKLLAEWRAPGRSGAGHRER
ncbi:hypothetical protein [Amycolatopsis thermoflava]|uniref:hypothetical protein n=1 Tax=Amycolatopsis thermoflava TaxID=84480 RepID=UPI0011CE4E21|nr:hypothetical protein [Amycolatopsis thermoflava]